MLKKKPHFSLSSVLSFSQKMSVKNLFKRSLRFVQCGKDLKKKTPIHVSPFRVYWRWRVAFFHQHKICAVCQSADFFDGKLSNPKWYCPGALGEFEKVKSKTMTVCIQRALPTVLFITHIVCQNYLCQLNLILPFFTLWKFVLPTCILTTSMYEQSIGQSHCSWLGRSTGNKMFKFYPVKWLKTYSLYVRVTQSYLEWETLKISEFMHDRL